MNEALAAHARGAVNTIIQLATVRDVPWDDAIALYPQIFQREADATLERIKAARERRQAR